MRRDWRANRLLFLMVSMFLCLGLILASLTGVLADVEGLAAAPLNFVSGLFNRIALSVNNAVTDLTQIQTLRERNAELEETLAQFQAELVTLREIASDYERLADLLEYTSVAQDQEYVTADVVGLDQSGFLRTLVINRGTRDGVQKGMPVVTRQGLVGRVQSVSANAARVQLISDSNSNISARLQTTRVEGSVEGRFPGNLVMTLIPLGQTIQEGDLVITSGLGGNLPPDLVIGQVVNIRPAEVELYQEAEVRSLVNFDTLEFVLVITSFQPVDQSVFEEQPES